MVNKNNMGGVEPKCNKNPHNHKDRISTEEIIDLMGTRRQIHYRSKGSWRQSSVKKV